MTTLYNTIDKSGKGFGWIRFTRGECPICNGARKDCRQSNATNFVHCRDTDANPVGWIFRDSDSQGFGMWQLESDAKEWNDDRRREWIERQRRENEAKKEQCANSLSPVERDKEIRKILNQLTLSTNDQAILKKRAYLSDERIENFRSVVQWQPLTVPVSPELAGTNNRGDKLNNPVDGILIPVPDESGLFVGLRLYNPNSKENGHGKYTPLSSSNRGVHPHLQNGELPIAVYWPKELQQLNRIGLCEGLEIKPAIAADRLGVPVIGFSGSNFNLSPKTLKQAIASIAKKLGTEGIACVLLPDAGAISNTNIFPQHQRILTTLESWGFATEVAYWGQGFDKEVGDIDEIESIDAINYLSAVEFAKIDPNTDKTRESHRKSFLKEMGALGSMIGSAIKQIARRAKRKTYTPKPIATGNTIEIKLGEYDKIPLHGEWNGARVIMRTDGLSNEQKTRHRANTYTHIARAGNKLVLDQSHTGSGKSYVMGALNAHEFYVFKEDAPETKQMIVYTSQSPRNPSTAAIEKDYLEMPARNNGYVADENKLSPSGLPVRHHPQCDDIDPSVLIGQNNCINYKQFWSLRSHGQSTEGLCSTCPFLEECQRGTGQGYGFLFEMFVTLSKAKKIRVHPTGTSVDMVAGHVMVNDEFSASMEPTILIATTKDEIWKQAMEFVAAHNDYSAIIGAVANLGKLTEPDDCHKKYGYDTRDALSAMGELPENIHTIIASVRNWEENENQKLVIPDDNGKYPESRPRVLSTVLAIWESGRQEKLSGAISIYQDKIAISVKNKHPQNLYEAGHFSAYQDATAQPYQLAWLLDIPEEEIPVVKEQDPVIDNLTIQPIDIGALCGNDRSEDLQSRIEKLRSSDKFRDMATVEYKKYARGRDLVHGSDARGSNLFEDEKALLVVGLYRQNMGAVRDQYICLTGRNISIADNDPEFVRYYEDRNFAELIQTIGRLRGNRRSNENLTIYVVDTDPCEGLKNFGYNVKPMIGVEEICPEAAPRGIQTKNRIMSFFLEHVIAGAGTTKEAWERASKVTQKQVAEFCNLSIARLKQIVTDLDGGWQAFKKGIVSLIYSFKEGLDLSDAFGSCELSAEDQAWMFSTYIPLLKAEYGGKEEDAWIEIVPLLDVGILSAEGLPAHQAAWILYCVFRKLVRDQDLPALIRLFAPEQDFV